jgi:hypothetical protein
MTRVQTLIFNSSSLIIPTEDKVLVVDSSSGEIIIETEEIPDNDARFSIQAAVLMPDVNILVTATITDEKYCDTKLWDMRSKKILATLLLNESMVNGIGITADGRSVISTLRNYHMIKTELYNDNAANWFEWIKNKTNLLQKYLLLHLYRAQQSDEIIELHPDSPEHRILCNLPTEPCNVKEMVEKYLLKKETRK